MRLKDYLQHVPELPESTDLDAEAILQEIIAQHGIFALQSYGRYSFAHLTFQEYYTAKYISDNVTAGTFDLLFKHITDDKWREVFLLTASLLSDGTTFLCGFENALQQLLTPYSHLAQWLQQIADRANESLSDYHTSAIRAFVLARAIALARDRALVRAPARDLDRALTRALALALALVLDRDLDRALARALALDLDLDIDIDIDRDFDRAIDFNCDIDLARDVDFARDLDRGFDRARDFNRDLDLALTLAHDLALDRTRDIDLDLDIDLKELISDIDLKELTSDLDIDIDLEESISKILRNCQSQGQMDLYTAISALEIPPDDALAEVWQRFADDLDQIVREQEALKRFDQLQTEAEELADELQEMGLSNEDWEALSAYVRATRLFYDCLQLTYTPNRKAFENRIFLPPLQPKDNP